MGALHILKVQILQGGGHLRREPAFGRAGAGQRGAAFVLSCFRAFLPLLTDRPRGGPGNNKFPESSPYVQIAFQLRNWILERNSSITGKNSFPSKLLNVFYIKCQRLLLIFILLVLISNLTLFIIILAYSHYLRAHMCAQGLASSALVT